MIPNIVLGHAPRERGQASIKGEAVRELHKPQGREEYYMLKVDNIIPLWTVVIPNILVPKHRLDF